MGSKRLRVLSQLLVFAVFTFLFLNTEYTDRDVLPYAVNIFLRMDPLVAGAASLASRALIALLWPALIMVGLTLIFGRFFCGWVCPMGAILDAVNFLKGKRKSKKGAVTLSPKFKFVLLAFLAGSSLFTLQLVFFFDPISVLIRSLAVGVYPAMNYGLHALFGVLYDTGSTAVTSVSEPAYGFLKDHFLSFSQQHFQTAAITGIIFIGILSLEFLNRRFWCRYLCPLGALLGVLGRYAPFARKVDQNACTSCAKCARNCPMDAIGEDFQGTRRTECITCLDCQSICPEKAITFKPGGKVKAIPYSGARRGLLTAFGLGVMATPIFGAEAIRQTGNPAMIRPPGALEENKFLARCTRCGECMRVCIANGLQPAVTEAGFIGVWSPVLVPRIGYCEYNCTLCGQVCPTGAIKRLQVQEKQKVKLGLAEVDRSRCIPWKGDSECIVCEEHCPTPEKAILLKEELVPSVNSGEPLLLKRPYVDETRCIGCGICETKCPLSDRAAIRVTSRGETRQS